VTNQVTTHSDGASQSQPQPDTGYPPDLPVSDPARRGQIESPGMACKRSGVRIHVSPQVRSKIRESGLVTVLVLGLGFVLRVAGLGAAANAAQLVSVIPLLAAVINWARIRHGSKNPLHDPPIRLGELLRTIADAQGLTGKMYAHVCRAGAVTPSMLTWTGRGILRGILWSHSLT
jgi:hypothetical protein